MSALNHYSMESGEGSTDAHLRTPCEGVSHNVTPGSSNTFGLFPRMSCQQTSNSGILDTAGSSLYSKATVVFMVAAIFFQSLGIFTESWCHLSWSSQRFTVGLWKGCVSKEEEKSNKHWVCSRKFTRSAIFGINWGVGPQVLITVSLVLMLFIELLVLGYTCVPRLTPYRLRLLELTFGLCILTGLLTLIGLILFGSEVTKYPLESNARIAWSFGMCVLSLLLVSASAAIVFLDRKLEYYGLQYQRQSIAMDPIGEHSRY